MSETQRLKPTLIKVARAREDAPEQYPGWIVPDTEDLFAIDERYPADPEYLQAAIWVITHIPSGMQVGKGDYTAAATREKAIEIAQRFYRESKAREWDVTSSDKLVAAHNALSGAEKLIFWEKVAGWPRKDGTAH